MRQPTNGSTARLQSDDPFLGRRFNPWKSFNGVFIPLSLLRFSGLGFGPKVLWGRLACYAGKLGYCSVSVDTLAKELGRSPDTVSSWLVELSGRRFIERVRVGRGREWKTYFLWHPILRDSLRDGISDPAFSPDQGSYDPAFSPDQNGLTRHFSGSDPAFSPDAIKEEKILEKRKKERFAVKREHFNPFEIHYREL